ncbi:MAG TPA: FAD-dependent oxidoreductase [Candidatus Micrarchaeia archaeon]|nr:FAD-dependent oxidoreductase [Candidatus Micrarchaeia archaeon]
MTPAAPATAVDVLVVGAGPAGLAAAHRLARSQAGRVLVVERDPAPGGLPLHCRHAGFGLRDQRRLLDGPHYARRWAAQATRAGADLWCETTCLEWTGARALLCTGPGGLRRVEARCVVLATGCRERPRHARLVPGTRPAGVLTTGSLQRLAALAGLRVGSRALVVGAERVSFSALLALRAAGVRVVAMTTEHPVPQAAPALRWATATRLRVPVWTGTRVAELHGTGRVTGVTVAAVDGTGVRRVACDTVIFTGDFVPDHELARQGGLRIDPRSRAPVVDGHQRTSRPGVFAAGNLLHAAETAAVAAACGTEVAAAVLDHLRGEPWPDCEPLSIRVERPLLWVSPAAVRPGETRVPHGHCILRVAEPIAAARIEVRQAGVVLATHRIRRALPTLPVHLPTGWLGRLGPEGGAVVLRLAGRPPGPDAGG